MYRYRQILLLVLGYITWLGLTGQNITTDPAVLLKSADTYREASNYDSALLLYEQVLADLRQKEDHENLIRALNGLGLTHIDLATYDKSTAYLLEAIELGNHHLDDNHTLHGESHARLGYCYSQNHKIDEAIENYEISLGIFKASLGEDNPRTALVYSRLGTAYYLKGNNSFTAIEFFLRSIRIFERLDEHMPLELARVYNDLANVYQDQHEFEKVIYYHEESLRIKETVLEPLHPEIGVSNFNLGRAYYSMGDYQRSIEYYQKTLEIDLNTFGENHRWVGEDYYSIADCYAANGNYQLALKYAQQSSDILLQAYGPDNPRFATSLSTTGQAYLNLGQTKIAIDYFERAFDIFANSEKVNRDILAGKALAHAMLGVAMSKDGLYLAAIDHLNQSINSGLTTMVDHVNFVAESYRNIGMCYLEMGSSDEALAAYDKALELLISEFGEHHPKVAETYLAMGDLFLREYNVPQALAKYHVALQSLVPNWNPEKQSNPSLNQLSMLPTTLNILNQKGWAFRQKYAQEQKVEFLEQSMDTYKLAMDLIDTLRIGFMEQGSKQSLLDNQLEVYERSLVVASELFRAGGDEVYLAVAFKVMEKSKAFRLLTSLRESKAKRFAGIPPEIIEQEHQLKVTLAFYETQARNETDQEKKLNWRNKVFSRGKSYDSLMDALSNNYSEYHRLKYNSNVLSLAEVKTRLKPNEAMVQYFVGSDSLYALALHNTGQQLFSKPLNATFHQDIELLRNSLSNKLPFEQEYARASYQMYQTLLEPAHKLLAGKSIHIVPDGVLNYFPFEILTSTRNAVEESYIDLAYLVYNHSFNYTFSATLLLGESPDLRQKQDPSFLAFAPKFNDRTEEKQGPGLLAYQEVVRGNLAELKGTKREINSIARYFKGELLQDGAATESEFKLKAPTCDIIHLATHAIVDDQNPMNSRLLFSSSTDTLNDGDLYVWELYNLQLNAQMAVLSACNTGFGKLERGEGVMSLGRAFAYAGCPSIVMSLWPAQDEATADIMERFYQGISEGLSKNQALATAKQDYLEATDDLFAHPFYWAGFVVQGDPKPLDSPGPNLYWYYLIILMVIGLIGFWLYKKRSWPLLNHTHTRKYPTT